MEFAPLHSLEEHSSCFSAALPSTLTPVLRTFPHLIPNSLRCSSSFFFGADQLLLDHSSLPEHVHIADSLVSEELASCSASFLEKCEQESWGQTHTNIVHWTTVNQRDKQDIVQEGQPSIMGALLSSVACLFSPLPDQPILKRAFEAVEASSPNQILDCHWKIMNLTWAKSLLQ